MVSLVSGNKYKLSPVCDALRIVGFRYGVTGPGILLFSSLSVGICAAQEAEDRPAEPRDHSERTLEEVIVTATKRSKSVRDIPFSIDAMQGDTLEARGAISLEEALKYSPGVNLTKGSNPDNDNITFRGVSGTSAFGNRTFGTFYEDVPLINPVKVGPQPSFDPFDMSTVEVLKGPQGTLFGGSALSGAVRYIPNDPDFEAFSGSIGYGRSSHAHSRDSGSRATAMLNVPFSDRFAIRAATSFDDNPGYINRRATGERDANSTEIDHVRFLVAMTPVDDLYAKLTYFNRDMSADGSSRADRLEKFEQSGKWGPENSGSDITITGVKLEWSGFEAVNISLIANELEKVGFSRVDLTDRVGTEEPNVSFITLDFDTDQTTYEMRVTSKGLTEHDWFIFRDWEFTAGLYSMESDQAFDVFLALRETDLDIASLLPGLPTVLPVDNEIDNPGAFFVAPIRAFSTEKAFYFDTTRFLFDSRMEVNIGGRYFDTSTDGTNFQAVTVTGEEKTTLVDEKIGVDETGFSPKLAVIWRFERFRHFADISLHGSVSKGFRFGGIQGDPVGFARPGEIPSTFDSDELWNHEIGLRTSWLDDRLRVDLTAFYIDWVDPQLALYTEPGALPDTEFIDNFGGVESSGGELMINAILPYGFSILTNIGYADTETTDSFDAPRGTIEAGTRLPNTPRWTGSAILSYGTEIFGWNLGGSVIYSYQDESRNDFFNTVPLDSFDSVGLTFKASNINLPFKPEITLSATNLFDERGVLAAGIFDDAEGEGEGSLEIFHTQPRVVTTSLRFSF